MDLKRKSGETAIDHHIRLLEGKLVNKSLSDVDYYDLSKYLYGKNIASDNCRRMAYGSLKTLHMLKEDAVSEQTHKTELTINSDGSQTRNGLIAMSEAQSKDAKFLLSAHGFDPMSFELVNAKNSMWNTSKKDGLITLYSSKITVKPISGITSDIVKSVLDSFSREYKPKEYSYKNYETNGACFILNYFDVHFAKLSHVEETGENYDWKIAKKRVIESTKEYISRIKDLKLEKIIFAVGNDYFNSEFTGMTNGGTPQDNDTRYYKMFEEGVKTLVEVIDMLAELAPVYVPLVQGNHDLFSSYSASQVLKAWYRNDERIEFDASTSPRKYFKFGNDLFGFSHHADEKDRLYQVMQIEVPSLWGQTLYRTWFTGHKHNEDVTEKGGVIVRQAPSMCSTDAWHKKMGFIGSVKKTQGFIYDKENGLTDIMYVVVK